MLRLTLTLAILALLAAACVHAQPFDFDPFTMTPRQLAMGGAAIAVANDCGAWRQNPAGLPRLNVPQQEGPLLSDLQINFGSFTEGSSNVWGMNWSGYSPAHRIGFGAGFASISEAMSPSWQGVGVGMQIGSSPFSMGASLRRIELPLEDLWYGNVGALIRSGQFAVGVRVDDVTARSGDRYVNAGASWQAGDRLLLAVDAIDATNVIGNGPLYCYGGELKVTPALALRAGSIDDGFERATSFGAGYEQAGYRFDFAYLDSSGGAFWSVGIASNREQ
jgi:hypothetical protein